LADRCLFGRAVDREEVDRLRKRFMKLDKVRAIQEIEELPGMVVGSRATWC